MPICLKFIHYFTDQDEKMTNLTATVENDVKNLQIEDEQLQAQLTGMKPDISE